MFQYLLEALIYGRARRKARRTMRPYIQLGRDPPYAVALKAPEGLMRPLKALKGPRGPYKAPRCLIKHLRAL